MAYLLLENGDRLQLEYGSGDLLLEQDELDGVWRNVLQFVKGNRVEIKANRQRIDIERQSRVETK